MAPAVRNPTTDNRQLRELALMGLSAEQETAFKRALIEAYTPIVVELFAANDQPGLRTQLLTELGALYTLPTIWLHMVPDRPPPPQLEQGLGLLF